MSNDEISDEDKKLFRGTMRGVVPLKKNKTYHPPPTRAPLGLPRKKIAEPLATEKFCLSNHVTEHVDSETTLTYSNFSLPKQRFLELKKGEIRWEARLDLHGNTLPQAEDKLCHFISHNANIGKRCVLIIHGKGSPNGQPPILKNAVNQWLRQLPHILAFHSALSKDGGTGALYVLLKRRVAD